MVSTAFATAPSHPRSDPQATDSSLVWQRVLSGLQINTGEAHYELQDGVWKGMWHYTGDKKMPESLTRKK